MQHCHSQLRLGATEKNSRPLINEATKAIHSPVFAWNVANNTKENVTGDDMLIFKEQNSAVRD